MYTTSTNQTVTTGQKLGEGGEGAIFEVTGQSDWVAKIYLPKRATAEKEAKLRAMIANPPEDPTRAFSPPHVSITWPTEILYEQNSFRGFLMPYAKKNPELFEVYNPQTSARKNWNWDWWHLHRTAMNLSAALNALHAQACVMGDVNQKNILVTRDALVTLVDTDSYQVKGENNTTYRCTVHIPEFTAPELQNANFELVDRSEEHDNFGLAILVFHLLMEGYHPFQGAPKDPTKSLPKIDLHCLRQGIFPYKSNKDFNPPPGAPKFDSLHPLVQDLFVRCFVDGHQHPRARPSALEWVKVLKKAETELTKCKAHAHHWYSSHQTECPWCKREKQKAKPRQQKFVPVIKPPPPPPTRPPQPPPGPTGWPGPGVTPYPRTKTNNLLRNVLIVIGAVVAVLIFLTVAGAAIKEINSSTTQNKVKQASPEERTKVSQLQAAYDPVVQQIDQISSKRIELDRCTQRYPDKVQSYCSGLEKEISDAQFNLQFTADKYNKTASQISPDIRAKYSYPDKLALNGVGETEEDRRRQAVLAEQRESSADPNMSEYELKSAYEEVIQQMDYVSKKRIELDRCTQRYPDKVQSYCGGTSDDIDKGTLELKFKAEDYNALTSKINPAVVAKYGLPVKLGPDGNPIA